MNQKLKVGLLGFGKAGKAVAAVLAQSPDVSLRWVIRNSNLHEHQSAIELLDVNSEDPAVIYSLKEFRTGKVLDSEPVEVLIDFSGKKTIMYYGPQVLKHKTAVVTAVSHYDEPEINYLNTLADQIPLLWSPNITIGVNFLMIASRVLKDIAPQADIEIIEEHFKLKPELSGTAKKLAANLDVPEHQVNMIRAGGIIGKHETLFGFPFQTIRLTHESISREAFGSGALFAATNMDRSIPGLFTMEDLLKPYFSMS